VSEPGIMLDHARADVALVIPRGYERTLARGETAGIQFLIDGTNSNSATIIRNYVEAIAAGVSRELHGGGRAGFGPRVRSAPARRAALFFPEVRVWYNEQLEAPQFMVPGVFATILFVISMILTAMGLTRERETGTYEQLIVSPIHPMAIMLGKTLPFALLGLISVTLILMVTHFIFDVSVKGSLLYFYGTVIIFLITMLSLGLFISSVAKTMQQALMLSFFVMLPMIILSGLMFPISSMASGFQVLTLLNPLRYFIEIIRGLFLKAVPLSFVGPRALVLLVMGLALLFVSAARFNKKLQ
jgi:ABC-2 type transport system permease protein